MYEANLNNFPVFTFYSWSYSFYNVMSHYCSKPISIKTDIIYLLVLHSTEFILLMI